MHQIPGDPPIALTLRRSSRARRFSLRVSGTDGRVTLTIPARAREAEALAFAKSQDAWLRKAIGSRPEARLAEHGVALPFLGRAVTIVPGTGRAVRCEGDQLLVPGDPARVPRRVMAFLREAARERLVAASDRHAAALGRPYSTISLRDPRSRWGSCSAAGGLMYSWRLVMAPEAVLDYVAAHEVAHLAEMNHSPRFWAVVARLCPDYAAPRAWLRREGAGLHAWRFGD
ncbi:MAG: SprT family zinc-dependent metalloprotease [Paracoccaceae bacterium]